MFKLLQQEASQSPVHVDIERTYLFNSFLIVWNAAVFQYCEYSVSLVLTGSEMYLASVVLKKRTSSS